MLFEYYKKHEDEDIQAQRSQQVCQKGAKSDLSEIQMLTSHSVLYPTSETSTVFI